MRPVEKVTLAVAILSFAASLAYSNYLVHRVNECALAISLDRVPRLEYISLSRGELLQATALANEYVVRGASDKKSAREQIVASCSRLRAELVAYRSLPLSADEVRPLRTIGNDINRLDTSLERALDEADAGAQQHALISLSETADVLTLDTEDMLQRLTVLNEQRIKTSTEHMLSMRHSAVGITMGLGLLSFGTAVGAAVMVLQGERFRARLTAQRDRLLTERATELESFAGRVAHDLRDPLNTVGLRLTGLLRRELEPQLRSDLERAQRQLRRMRSIIDGLLDFARAGANPGYDAGADLALILEDVVASVLPAAEAVGAELRIGTFPRVHLAITPEALRSVLSNLLGNAVKYVGEGRLLPHRISVRVTRRAGCSRIEVEDNGPGLPSGAEERLFKPFHRLASKQPGTGLGLATVKRIVEAYKGRVGVIAESGRGSTFWVELPLSEEPVTPLTHPQRGG
jgi:signal transduction histidine kinase